MTNWTHTNTMTTREQHKHKTTKTKPDTTTNTQPKPTHAINIINMKLTRTTSNTINNQHKITYTTMTNTHNY